MSKPDGLVAGECHIISLSTADLQSAHDNISKDKYHHIT